MAKGKVRDWIDERQEVAAHPVSDALNRVVETLGSAMPCWVHHGARST
jgi:hypothetical protein